MEGTAVGIMAMSLDSHVFKCGLSPGPGGLNSRWACVCVGVPKIQRGEWRRDCGMAIPLGSDFSLSVSHLCLSGEGMHPIAKEKKIIIT